VNTTTVHKVFSLKFVNLLRVFLIGLVLLPFQLFVPLSYAIQPTVGSWTALGLTTCGTWEPSVDPNNANIIYIPSCLGLAKSVDGGTSWSIISHSLGKYGPVLIDPRNSNVMYAMDGVNGGIWKTTDGGANWTNITAYLNLPYVFNVSNMVMDPNNPNVLYSGNYQSGGVWKTTDGGTTWNDTSLGNDIARILVDPTNSNIVYASIAGNNLYKSTDGGTTWTGYNINSSNVRGIAIDPNNHNILYVGTGNGVYKSTDGGVNWTFLSTGPQGDIESALITDPTVQNTVYAGDTNGVHMSSDGGANWHDINSNLPSLTAKYLLIPANNRTVLYASTTIDMYEYGLRNTPSVNTISVATSPVQVNTPITTSANFTDPDTTSTHTATWNWGDIINGNPDITQGTVTESNGSGTVGADSHTYTATGVYTITLTVTNNSGGVGTAQYQYVAVYNPTSQGLFSGAHKFSSPAGAYPQNSSLTGDVTFGLSYKYQGTMPVGDRQFTMNFSAAPLLFNATTVSSLVIANNVATLTGTGTINGTGTYNFLVTGVNGSGIRVQITDPSNNNAVIYDTQPGAAATATPTTAVTGNVIAHN